MSHIAIIGAGMSGLAALTELSRHGHQVTVFEKSRGSGGRMASKKLNDSSWDMGAQFMRAHSDEFAAQLQQWQAEGWISRWDIQPWQITGDERQPSADTVKRYVSTPRMTGLSRQLLGQASQFISQTRIVAIQHTDTGYTLQDDQGQTHSGFDAVVVAIPPAQAESLLVNQPELKSACQADMLPCWTLLLTFDTPLDTPFDAAFVKQGAASWISRNNSKPGRDERESWVIHANHEWSREHLDSDRGLIQQILLQTFNDLVQTDQQPLDIWLHRWLYAIPADTGESLHESSADGGILLCGDWLSRPSIEGAWLSGRAAAAAWLQQIA